MIALIAALLSAVAPADRLPKRAELPCFPCHSQVKFEKGPGFAHAGPGHRTAGHCHTCHQGSGHEGRAIDQGACLSCHEKGSQELKILAAGMGNNAPVKEAVARKPPAGGALQCATCHTSPQFDPSALSRSVHASLSCSDCHKGYDFSLERKPAPKQDAELIGKLAHKSVAPAALAACGSCHESQLEDWKGSVHGRFVHEKRPVEGASCLDCHGEPHSIARSSSKPPFAQRAGMAGSCLGCHANEEVVKKAGLSDTPGHSFRDSVHGRMNMLQNDRAPGCANCHGAHDIAPVASEASMVNPKNKVATCAECHKGATANFAALFTHQPVKMRPGPHYTEVAFSWLTALVLTLLIVHVVLDLGNEIRRWSRRRRGLEPNNHDHVDGPKTVVRFDKHQLAQHWLLIASVLTLVLSDWPVRMAGVGASLTITNALGGVKVTSLIHRTAGIVMGVAALYHLVYLTVLIVKRQRVFAMLPSAKDLRDVWDNGAYFLGLREERPKFARFAYHEKFDYWAVFWGVVIMFGTGLIRWFPVWFAKWVPAPFIEGCQIAHGDEATLAALVLFTWHLYNVHLKPTIFPMNWVWIDGRIETAVLREEHRAEYEQLTSTDSPAIGGKPGN